MSSKDFSRELTALAPYQEFFFASYVPDRREGPFKRHTNLGHAKNAANYSRRGRIYKYDANTGEWNELPWRPGN